MVKNKNERVQSIDFLRGVASMSVVLYHVTHANDLLSTDGIVYNLFKSGGGFGVSVFFLISGYVLPYSLDKSEYSIKNYYFFFVKRIRRIEPVFIASIFLTIYVFYAASQLPTEYWKFGDYKVDFTNFVLHIGYFISFFKNQEWINPVFWSLGVEFQYYLIIGLIFPLLVVKRDKLRVFNTVLLILVFWLLFIFFIKNTYLHYGGTVLRVMPMFFLGTIIFQYQKKLMSVYLFWPIALLLFYICYSEFNWGDLAGIIFAFASIFLIKFPPRPFLFLGKISFSLYLIHVPLGGFMKLFIREHFQSDLMRTLFVFLSIIPILIISYAFYKIIEEPSMKWSKKVGYNGN